MINIYKSGTNFKGDEIILDNESFFNNNVSARSLTDMSLTVMNEIDKAVLLDKKSGKIETPYGITGIRDLSTGCKTVLNYIFIKENTEKYPNVKAIDGTECGWNALDKLFDIIEKEHDSKIIIVLQHDNDLYKCQDRKYCIDGITQIDTLYDF